MRLDCRLKNKEAFKIEQFELIELITLYDLIAEKRSEIEKKIHPDESKLYDVLCNILMKLEKLRLKL